MVQKNKQKLFIIGIFLSFICWQLYQDRKVEIHIPVSKGPELILTIPVKDKKRLEYIFQDIIGWDAGAYTFFGNKPMSIFGYQKPFCMIDRYRFLSSIRLPSIRCYLALKAWKKYQHLFENGKFLFYAEENPLWQSRNGMLGIFLINKEKFKETITLNIQDFKAVLKKEDLSGEEMLFEAKNKQLLETILLGHNGLIGTLLGFGRNNAWMFEEREHGKIVPLKPLWDEDSKEINFLDKRPYFAWFYFGVASKELGEYLGYPAFMADPDSEETRNLKQEFHKTRQRIIEYYKGKDFLETTLGILMNGTPN